jgi:AraC family transcriptional regulator
MGIIRQSLFKTENLQIWLVEALNVSDKCGDVERQDQNSIVLPLSGIFLKHDAPRHYVVGTPSHAVFIAADASYKLSFPGAIGDRALALRFDDAIAPEHLGRSKEKRPASSGLLPVQAMLLRNLLHARLKTDKTDRFEIETRAIDLLDMSLETMHRHTPGQRRAAAQVRWSRSLERVKEAVAVNPANKWSIDTLAHIAGLSPFYLCRVFKRVTGATIYEYVLRERLAASLDSVLDGEDLASVAFDSGFASHSHFTAHFHRLFGSTPAALRRQLKMNKATELRKIVTAQRNHQPLD